uniref:High mobility group protein 20A-like n=1 Tax=Bos indicus x Bos taurus TaxID=30522 RepID=A0A4W2FYV4_BOBOX
MDKLLTVGFHETLKAGVAAAGLPSNSSSALLCVFHSRRSYTIFLNEQRSQLRAQHPSLPFPEITKMLAAQWAHLPQEKKQADENDDLYCRTCRQFFSSLHNKREHLLGKQHLQNLTGEFEKDSAECLKHLELLEGEEGQNLNKGDSEEEAEYPDPLLLGGLIPEKGFASFDLCFLQEFIFKLLQIKESELRELRKTLERAQAEQEALQRQLLEFQNRQQWLEVELASLKTYGVILEKEFENLNTVIMLPHFGLRVMDTGESLCPSSGLTHASSRSSLVCETEAQKFLSIHLVVPSSLTSSLSLLLARPVHPSLVPSARDVEMNGHPKSSTHWHQSLIWVLPGDEDTEKPLASSSNCLDPRSLDCWGAMCSRGELPPMDKMLWALRCEAVPYL